MEKLVRIKQQSSLRVVNYQAQDGTPKVFKTVDLLVSDGIDTFICEVSDTMAEAIAAQPLNPDYIYNVQIRMSVNKAKEGDRLFTSIRVLSIQSV